MRTLASLSAACAIVASTVLPGARSAAAPRRATEATGQTAILVYHRFGQVAGATMAVRATTFQAQLQYLKQQGYEVIPLRAVVSHLLGRGPAPPARAVVITADDGHVSVFTDMFPIVRMYQVPVTLFIYPSAISNASYAMTWDQLATLQRSGLFDIESHTYWHPNFRTEKRRLSPDAYRAFVRTQLVNARTTLHERLGTDADLLAWPFGIHDEDLMAAARDAGYIAAFTLDRRPAASSDPVMALPRFVAPDSAQRAFTSILPSAPR